MKTLLILALSLVHFSVLAEVCGPIHDLKRNTDNSIKAFNVYFDESYDLQVNTKNSPELLVAFNEIYNNFNSIIDFDICFIEYGIYVEVIDNKVQSFVRVPKWRFIPLQ